MFFSLVSLSFLTLTNQQFVNCANLEILAIAPALPVRLCETSPSCTATWVTKCNCAVHKETPVSRLPVERCLSTSYSLSRTTT